jgi:subtilisin family serine protease
MGVGISLLLVSGAAMAQTQLSLQESSLNVTADHSGNVVVNIHLDSLGPNAAVYGIVGRADGPGGGARGAVAVPAPIAPTIVRSAVAVDWTAPHQADELIVCYDETRVSGVEESPAALAVREGKDAVHQRLGTTLQKELRRINADLVRTAPGTDLQVLAQRYAQQPGVSFIQPNYIYEAIALPDDPNFPFVPSSLGPPDDQLLWGLHTTAENGAPRPADVAFDSDIDAAEAWEVTTGSSDVIVAVIDTGVNFNHPDIVANMWTNPGEIDGNGIDDDGNGYIDDYHGYDFINDDGDPNDDHFHGTHVAGTIGAVGGNGVNIAGVCWNVRIMALKFLGSNGRGSSADAADAVDYAVSMGAMISNNSWGGGSFDAALVAAINNAGQAGHLFLAAAGNNSTDTDVYQFYPSTYNVNTILSVAAWGKNELLADFSNYGATSTDIAAPGVGIYSLQHTGGIFPLNGTSMATPHVAGVAALLKSVRPEAGPLEIKQWILDGATPHPNLAGKVLTGGRLNAVEPLRLATMPWLRVDNREGIIGPGGLLTIPVTFVTDNTPVGSYSGSLIVLDLSYDNAVTPRIEIPVSMDLQFVELPPVVEDVYQFVVRNYPMTVTLEGYDRNIGQSITFTIEMLPALGTLIDPATGQTIASAPYALGAGADTLTYVPAADQIYSETFQYTATDGTTTSNIGTVELDVIESPHEPEDVSAVSGNIYVELNWLPSVDPNLAGYNIYASPGPGGPYLKVDADPFTGTTYRHYPSGQNPTYYVVTAVLDFGAESGYSAEASGQPTYPSNAYKPQNLRATPGDNKVYLAWDAPQTFHGWYRIIRRPVGGNEEIIAEPTGKFDTEYVDEYIPQWGSGPENGVTYEYYVENYTYWDLWGSSSDPVSATPDVYTPPSIPTGLEALAGDGYVDVRWDFNPELDIDYYAVLRSTVSGAEYYYQGSVTDRRFYDQNVLPGTTYYYVIIAFDIDGDESDWSAEVSATPFSGNCTQDAQCADGVYCNGVETCVAGECQPGAAVNCNDGVGCTIDSCNEATETCEQAPSDALCDDGAFCNGAETCDPVLDCQPGSDPCPGQSCDEGGNFCFDIGCDDDGTCEAGEDCNTCPNDCFSGSGASCGNDICETANGEDCLTCPQDCNSKLSGSPAGRYCCGDGTATYGVTCADSRCTGSGNACVSVPAFPSCCGDAACAGSEDAVNCAVDCAECAVPGDCDDGDACTTDDCVAGLCENLPIACDDGDACTTDSCAGGVCMYGPVNCDDGDSCSSDSCDPSTGCENAFPACGLSDGCCGPDCTPASDPDCPCGAKNAPCSANEQCCSLNCRSNGRCG